MNNGLRFADNFKQDALAQIVERAYAVSELAELLEVNTNSPYTLKIQFATSPRVRTEASEQAAEINEAGAGAVDRFINDPKAPPNKAQSDTCSHGDRTYSSKSLPCASELVHPSPWKRRLTSAGFRLSSDVQTLLGRGC